jgi:hypothetical protein
MEHQRLLEVYIPLSACTLTTAVPVKYGLRMEGMEGSKSSLISVVGLLFGGLSLKPELRTRHCVPIGPVSLSVRRHDDSVAYLQ